MAYTNEIARALLKGPFADRPLASVGRYWYLATDTDGGTLYKSDGSTWTQVARGVSAGGSGVTYGTPALTLGTANSGGSTDEAIRRDATLLAFDATAPTTQAFGDAAAAGAAAVAARRDHKHAMPASPTTVSGNAGTATALQTSRNIDGQAFNGTADITVIAPGTHAATSKVTPVDNDELALVDSAASNVLKRLLWSNVKATLKTYFDTLYTTGGGTSEVDYVEFTSNVNVTATTEATANSIVTGSSVAFDGSTAYLIEFFAPGARPDNGAVSRILNLYLYEDGASIGRIAFMTDAASGNNIAPLLGFRRRTPSAGSHTYSVRAAVDAGTGVVAAGAGGSTATVPGFIRIAKV